MLACLGSVRQHLWEAWVSVQVEYQGSYSVERLRRLENYMTGHHTKRLLLVCLLTPIPCVVLSLAKELPPLEPADAGVHKNWVFFARAWGVMCFMGVSALVQMGHGAPQLKLTNSQVAAVSLLAATVSAAFIFGLCVLTTFPLPFGLLIAGPPFVLVIAVCFTIISGPRWRADPALLVEVKRQIVVYQCQTTLPFVYPLYILGFVSLTGWNQVMFVAVLPLIQILAKNWISRALGDDHDQKPQCMVFVVEVYNALYVSNVLQSSSSWTSTAAIMVVDLLQFWVAMIDVVKILNILMAKIPRGHPLAKENFVRVAVRLMDMEETLLQRVKQDVSSSETGAAPASIKAPARPKEDALVIPSESCQGITLSKGGNHCRCWNFLQKGRVFPFHSPSRQNRRFDPQGKALPAPEQAHICPSLGLELIFSPEERALFIQKSSRVLFITECLVLVEYVEVVLPFAYCIHQLVLFHMHNGAYYPTLAGLSGDQFSSRIRGTLLYSLFEFASFVMLIVVLKRKLGYSSLQQLAFVLDAHAGMVQTKLNLIFVYIMQVSLAHHDSHLKNLQKLNSLRQTNVILVLIFNFLSEVIKRMQFTNFDLRRRRIVTQLVVANSDSLNQLPLHQPEHRLQHS